MKWKPTKIEEIPPKEMFKTKEMLINWIYRNMDQFEEAIQVKIADFNYVVIGIPFEERPDICFGEKRRPNDKIAVMICLDRITKAKFKRIVDTANSLDAKKAVLIVTKVPQNLFNWLDKILQFRTEYIILKLSVSQIENSVMVPHLSMVNYSESVNTRYFRL